MDTETRNKIEETVLEILRNSNMDETTELKIRKEASEKMGMDLSEPTRKKFVRKVVESYLTEQQAKATAAAEEEPPQQEEEEEEEENSSRKRGREEEDEEEYDDEGGLIICRISDKRKVTVSKFRGKTLVSIREFYTKNGKELPSNKGISLTLEQWESFRKYVPAIERGVRKMESR